MASEPRNSTAKAPTLDELLKAAESKWHEDGRPAWSFVFYELRGKTIHVDYVPARAAFMKVRGWMLFLKSPGYTHKCVFDERGRNKNQYWNDLENWICRYNIASVSQNLLWISGTDKHSVMPDHRRLPRESQPQQKPPFPEWLMVGYVPEENRTATAGPLARTVEKVIDVDREEVPA